MLARLRCAGVLIAATTMFAAFAATPSIAPFSAATGAQLPPPWRVVTLPKIPRHTSYSVVDIDSRRALRAEANGSYANVLHPVDADINGVPWLRFSWRVDRFAEGSDLRRKDADDVAAKVCLLFDLPLERLSIGDRVRIELGRRIFDPELPTATLCYLWDRTLTPGTFLPNAYTDRVRMLVLRSAQAGESGRWFDERRDLRADFIRAFGTEAGDRLPTLKAVAVATDADNTGASALAYFGDIRLSAE